jgi:hypothetical protein
MAGWLAARFTTQILGKNFTTAISCGPGAIHYSWAGHRHIRGPERSKNHVVTDSNFMNKDLIF